MTDENSTDETKDDARHRVKTGYSPSGSDPLGQLREYSTEHPLIEEMDITFESFDDGTIEAFIPHNDRWANPGMEGALHGGIVVAYLDTVMGFTLMAVTADRPVKSGPTINLNTNFLAPAATDITAIGEVVRIGSSIAVVEGTLEDAESGAAIAKAQGVWRLYPDDE